MNRYRSIVENRVGEVLKDLKELHPKLPNNASWSAKDGKLTATINGKEFEFFFERGDPITEALLLFLNNNHFILTVLEQR